MLLQHTDVEQLHLRIAGSPSGGALVDDSAPLSSAERDRTALIRTPLRRVVMLEGGGLRIARGAAIRVRAVSYELPADRTVKRQDHEKRDDHDSRDRAEEETAVSAFRQRTVNGV